MTRTTPVTKAENLFLFGLYWGGGDRGSGFVGEYT